MKEMVLFSKTSTISQEDKVKSEEKKSFSVSIILYIVLILGLLTLIALPLCKCHCFLTQSNLSVLSNNDIIAVSSWILGFIALIISILMVIKEFHSARVRSLKDIIDRKKKTIINLGNSWLVLYEAGVKCSTDKVDFDKERNAIRDDKGIDDSLTPSQVKKYIENNCL